MRETRPGGRLAVIFACLVAATSASNAGPSVNQFEVKDLESEPGEMQFQSQNAISSGFAKRRVTQGGNGDLVYDDNTVAKERYALEMQMGITSWFRTRVGIEFEKERVDDPTSVARANAFQDLHLTGVALEGVFVFVPVKKEGIGLGLLTELDAPVRGGTRQVYVGPIVHALSGPWSALANLMLVQQFGSPQRGLLPEDRKQDFAYAAQVKYDLSDAWGLALWNRRPVVEFRYTTAGYGHFRGFRSTQARAGCLLSLQSEWAGAGHTEKGYCGRQERRRRR
jgi:hypothetical protein